MLKARIRTAGESLEPQRNSLVKHLEFIWLPPLGRILKFSGFSSYFVCRKFSGREALAFICPGTASWLLAALPCTLFFGMLCLDPAATRCQCCFA